MLERRNVERRTKRRFDQRKRVILDAKVLEVVNVSVAGSRFSAYKSEQLLRDDYSATFTTAMMLKDIDLVLDGAREAGIELPIAQELRVLLEETIEDGHADEDFMALYLRLRSLNAGAGAG